MNKFLLSLTIIGIVLFAACEGDYRPRSVGSIDEVYVVMDSTDWNSQTALALEETFGKVIPTKILSWQHLSILRIMWAD